MNKRWEDSDEASETSSICSERSFSSSIGGNRITEVRVSVIISRLSNQLTYGDGFNFFEYRLLLFSKLKIAKKLNDPLFLLVKMLAMVIVLIYFIKNLS